ncbi:MAG TPA: NADH-quinone oxidoreductase subunit NuoG [Gammaproteobacteria bacterium]|jgi:NADH-quinone oxidoreductase subunit G|nr:NADH-quinone oxidoreductase subunit NuoG [Gammaproteobacteria bacterium]
MADIEFEIDGQPVTAKPNQTVIQVADEAGIYIPRFCYHKALSRPANCRMCLVEVEKAPKPVPACATPCMPGMKVFTKSAKALTAQRAVMEFLLINHPLDCPICDQGGECELQDLSMGYGSSTSKFDECKHAVPDKDIGPLIATELTRCIKCTRCVRFGDEIAGMRELGVLWRGEDADIGTYVQHAILSEVSGNMIDVCPVGALTSKPYRFTARAWELNQAPSIAPHDCLGSHIHVHTRYGKVMRVVSRESAEINQSWISDRDRFSYTGLYHANRLKEPLLRKEGRWQTVGWEEALQAVSLHLQDAITEFGSEQLGGLISPHATVEECYLFQKIVRSLGSPHVDHRLRERDMQDQASMGAFPGLSMSVTDIADCDAIVLIGSNIQKEQPIAALQVRQAVKKGAAVIAINPIDYHFNFDVTAKEIVPPQQMVSALADLLTAVKSQDAQHHIVMCLQGKQKICILLGALAFQHQQAASLRYYAQQLAQQYNGTLGLLTAGSNSAGAWLAGAVPHRLAGAHQAEQIGLDAYHMLANPRKAYLLFNVEPALDCANAHLASLAFKQARFVCAFSLFRDPVLEAYADVILPIGAFAETSGTYVNAAGAWQSFQGVANPEGSSRPAWKILRALGNFLHLDGFAYESSEEIRHEVKALCDQSDFSSAQSFSLPNDVPAGSGLHRVGEVPIYAIDAMVRHASPLQAAQTVMMGEVGVVRLHPETAARHQLKTGDRVSVKQQTASAELSVVCDERVAKEALWVPGGVTQTSGLGDLFGEIEISKC